MKFLTINLVLICFCFAANAQPTLKLFPAYQSIGYQISYPTGYDADSSATIKVEYRTTSGTWSEGFFPTRLNIGGKVEQRGSLFFLEQDTKYILRITITDSTPTFKKDVISDSVSTLKEVSILASASLKYVSPNGNGTAYTKTNPGNIKTLLSGGLSCGTTVIFLDGTYDVGDMTLNLINDCGEKTPIILMAEKGAEPILDAGDTQQYIWTKVPSDSNMYYATVNSNLEYNTLCMFGNLRLYPYPFLNPNSTFKGYPCLSDLGYDQSGFYRKGNLVYIKTLDGKDPNKVKITFSKYFGCLAVNGNGKENNLYIKGIRFKYYSKGLCDMDIFKNPSNCYPSYTLRFTNTSHIIVDSCFFEFSNFPVNFVGVCNYNLVQGCKIEDGTGDWSHGAFKQTREVSFVDYGSYGRYLENGGIIVTPSNNAVLSGNIFRNNEIKGVVSGIIMGSTASNYSNTECEVSGNEISHCYDGIDMVSIGTPSTTVNARIWGNDVSFCPVGISLIAPSQGPYYIFRNTLHLTERKNHNNDIFFMDCDNVKSTFSWSTGLKLNAGYTTTTPGSIYFMHNTLYGLGHAGFDLYLWDNVWGKLWSRNNIYYSSGKSSLFFDGIKDLKTYSFNSAGDDYFNIKSGDIATIQPVNGIASCNYYASTKTLNSGLKTVTASPYTMVAGYELKPDFVNDTMLNFRPNATSPIIDLGVRINGINDNFEGKSPDIGAYEYIGLNGLKQTGKTSTELSVYPNPTKGLINVEVSSAEENFEIKVYNMMGQLVCLTKPEEAHSHSFTMNLSGKAKGIYILTCKSRETEVRKKVVLE